MSNDRIKKSATQIIGSARQAVGKALGGPKLQDEGKADVLERKVRNTIGGMKDAIREA
jgi:uncharacterized protein YjbJ (UPF0337 family)